jgi:predicted transposase/invertase (TIGR01784 family)
MDSWLDDARHEGREEAIHSVVKNLLRKNMSHEDIADATGLSLEEVKKLAADLS